MQGARPGPPRGRPPPAGSCLTLTNPVAAAYPDAGILVTGVEDPDSRPHGANEGLHLAEFEKACVAEALLLAKLAR